MYYPHDAGDLRAATQGKGNWMGDDGIGRKSQGIQRSYRGAKGNGTRLQVSGGTDRACEEIDAQAERR